jgi:hypothetical protein
MGKDEIEISEEMIEAGVAAFDRFCLEDVSQGWVASRGVVLSVLRASEGAKVRSSSEADLSPRSRQRPA